MTRDTDLSAEDSNAITKIAHDVIKNIDTPYFAAVEAATMAIQYARSQAAPVEKPVFPPDRYDHPSHPEYGQAIERPATQPDSGHIIDRLIDYARDYTNTTYHDDLIKEAIKVIATSHAEIEMYKLKFRQDGERLSDQIKRIEELEAGEKTYVGIFKELKKHGEIKAQQERENVISEALELIGCEPWVNEWTGMHNADTFARLIQSMRKVDPDSITRPEPGKFHHEECGSQYEIKDDKYVWGQAYGLEAAERFVNALNAQQVDSGEVEKLRVAKEAEKWRMEAERLRSELLFRDSTVLPEKDAEYERLQTNYKLDISVRESRIDEANRFISDLSKCIETIAREIYTSDSDRVRLGRCINIANKALVDLLNYEK